jgi:membrane-associated protein
MDFVATFVDLFLHLDDHLDRVIQDYGVWTYGILFTIVFCETGLVVTPILPGDSLLFAAGAMAARGSMDVWLLSVLLIVAAVLGDACNYAIGNYMGPRVLERDGRFLKRVYLERTQRFFEKYGGKTIILARFVPIVRTFAPFLAGVGTMTYPRFACYNVLGAVLWVVIFVWGGYWFGNIPVVQKNFTLVVLAIVFVSVMPAFWEWLRSRRERMAATSAAPQAVSDELPSP